MAVTYGSLLMDTRARLRRAEFPAASLEAQELVCYAAGKSKEHLLRDLPLYASEKLAREVECLVQRRLAGEPVAYLIGEWDFFGLTLNITRDVLIPRQDSETLVQRALQRLRGAPEGTRVLDLCAGSGCLGLALGRAVPEVRVVLAEREEGALRVCRQNIRRCALNARVICLRVDALEPPAESLRDFQLILCNPPYIPSGEIPALEASVRDYEPHIALDGGVDGLDFYRGILPLWKRALLPGGALLFEVGAGQDGAVARLLRANGFRDLTVTPDTQGIPRVVEGILPG